MSGDDDYEMAKSWASESAKTLLAFGAGSGIIGTISGYLGTSLYTNSNKYWCHEQDAAITTSNLQPASEWAAPPGCSKAFVFPVFGPVFDAETTGAILGVLVAMGVFILAVGFMFLVKRG